VTVSSWQLDTPVAISIFNRPQTTVRVFEAIRSVRPPRLLVIADGARPDRPGEAEACAATRAIVEAIDWECELSLNYSEANLGCRRRISSGLDWVFDTVEEAIVLEDDCLPSHSFFRFCEELLDRYRTKDRVMHISGDNFQSVGRSSGFFRGLSRRIVRPTMSYYFSRYPHVWGWASWRRAWAHYDVEMRAWDSGDDRARFLSQISDLSEREFWRETWDQVSRGESDTWDYQWAFACMALNGFSVMPAANLVSNIGFGGGSTHTGGESELANLPTVELDFPLRHPTSIDRDIEADRHSARLFFGAGG
jgi:hypothetical protein